MTVTGQPRVLLDKDPQPSTGVHRRLPEGGVRTESLGKLALQLAGRGGEGRYCLGQVSGADLGRWVGGGRHEGVAGQALGTGARTTGSGAPQAQGAPQRPTRPPVPAARGEAGPGAGQQETAEPPGPRAQHGCWRPRAGTPRTGREGGREAARGGPGHPPNRRRVFTATPGRVAGLRAALGGRARDCRPSSQGLGGRESVHKAGPTRQDQDQLPVGR